MSKRGQRKRKERPRKRPSQRSLNKGPAIASHEEAELREQIRKLLEEGATST